MDYNLLQTQTPSTPPHPLLFPSVHPHPAGGGTAHYMTGAGKRERESDHLPNHFSSLPINRFSKQQCVFPNHPQWLQAEKRQPNSLVSTGLHLSFSDSHRQQQRQNKLHCLQNQTNTDHDGEENDENRGEEEEENLDLTAAINFHNDEIDRFLQAQREQLRRTLEGTRRKHYHALISAAELSVSRRMQEKATELETATKRNAELEERVSILKSEITSLQAEARADEVTVAALQAQLRQATAKRMATVDVDNPAVSDEESSCVDPRRERKSSSGSGFGNGICRKCWSSAATVVVLPCQHLCVCRNCDGGDICPVCSRARSASVEVYLS